MEHNILILDEHFFKLDPGTKRVISKSINKLQTRFNSYNIPISKIFGDDVLIHDIVHGRARDYYVYKSVSDNLQIRLLYAVDNTKIIIISHFLKKKNNKKYLNVFQRIVDNITY